MHGKALKPNKTLSYNGVKRVNHASSVSSSCAGYGPRLVVHCRSLRDPANAPNQKSTTALWSEQLRIWTAKWAASSCAVLLAAIFVSSECSTALAAIPLSDMAPNVPEYASQIKEKRRRKRTDSMLPSASEASALLVLNRDLWTKDSWEGMMRIVEYSKYIESLEDLEDSSSCQQCAENRKILENAWQVVANEFYDTKGKFSQARWAEELPHALQSSGGLLKDKTSLARALHIMVAHLGDPYTQYLEPSQFRRALRRPQPAERAYLEAQYTGVGLRIGSRSPGGGWEVDTALAESAAEEAGIVRGDRVLEVDGYPADDLTVDEVTALMRGPAGSQVILTLAPPASEPLPAPSPGPTPLQTPFASGPHRVVSVERRPLPQPPLLQMRLGGSNGVPEVAYLRLHYFSEAATQQLAVAAREAERAGVKGYIIDLRNNPGGVFEEAIAAASLFLDGTHTATKTVRNGELVDVTWKVGGTAAEGAAWVKLGRAPIQGPVVILTNRSSASASEVLAGALRDNHRATLVGQQTFGKGTVQYYFPMVDGSGMKVTVAKYLTPAGYDISRRGGLAPDLVCDDFPHAEKLEDGCVRAALKLISQASRGGVGGSL